VRNPFLRIDAQMKVVYQEVRHHPSGYIELKRHTPERNPWSVIDKGLDLRE
jgi:hypothetical protein